MTKRQFLSGLEDLWRDVMFNDAPLTVEELLDDAGTLGVDGASDVYLHLLKDRMTKSDGCM